MRPARTSRISSDQGHGQAREGNPCRSRPFSCATSMYSKSWKQKDAGLAGRNRRGRNPNHRMQDWKMTAGRWCTLPSVCHPPQRGASAGRSGGGRQHRMRIARPTRSSPAGRTSAAAFRPWASGPDPRYLGNGLPGAPSAHDVPENRGAGAEDGRTFFRQAVAIGLPRSRLDRRITSSAQAESRR